MKFSSSLTTFTNLQFQNIPSQYELFKMLSFGSKELKVSNVQYFRVRLASFGDLGLVSENWMGHARLFTLFTWQPTKVPTTAVRV